MIDESRILFDSQIREKYKTDFISGSDEAGRGAMAGPVVVASVILPKDYKNCLIRDSKKLSKKQRKLLCEEIKSVAISYAIEIIEADEVDILNPKQASRIGMTKSIMNLKPKPDLCLIDAENIIIQEYVCAPFIKGDDLSQSIAAASILAKTTRDNIMLDYAKIYPEYNFESHKGYCVKEHVEKTKMHGVLPIHRKTYKPIKDILENNF
ncbi:Ribonuclease HII [Mesoplasma florum W37]|uniref:Ribonuclease n=1 Tax=Mesoplasma florum TaxID=2151 RepID=A0AAD0HS78_MESFO|nr:ribonuclease HII [Mesoplasma florum]AGY41633.1 Ribonuclease HII [Mesoplasma florum W37]AVN59841.1 ribonuclease HII [Mesoplasma florum]AVN65971.1 Ribonuclease HII [Mesoplasma florum]